MKKLLNVKSEMKDGKITITADVVECEAGDFRFPMQQVTVGFYNPENIKWPRHIQISQEATFVKAFGNGLAIPHEALVEIASLAEPKTSYPPLFKKKIDENLTAEISSELNPDFQWQVSDSIKPDAQWENIEGQTSITLDKSKVLAGKFVRLVASSDAGSMTSNPFLIK